MIGQFKLMRMTHSNLAYFMKTQAGKTRGVL